METKKGSCHCGSVRFEVYLENGLEDLRRCNCSLCRRKGAIMGSVLIERLKVTQGEEYLTLYQWNTRTAKHYFCQICGIYTHHQRRSNPAFYGYNVACIEGINLFDLSDVATANGSAQSIIDEIKT